MTTTLPGTFGTKVRSRLAAMDKSQTELAKVLGTNQSQVSVWISNKGLPSTDYLIKISKYLNLSIDYLVDDTQTEPPGQKPTLENMVSELIGLHRAQLEMRERALSVEIQAVEFQAKFLEQRREAAQKELQEIRHQKDKTNRLIMEAQMPNLYATFNGPPEIFGDYNGVPVEVDQHGSRTDD
jgi:transcriptional regulator with XRE-family HTH domain